MKGLEQTFKTDASLKISVLTFARGGLECVPWDTLGFYLALWCTSCAFCTVSAMPTALWFGLAVNVLRMVAVLGYTEQVAPTSTHAHEASYCLSSWVPFDFPFFMSSLLCKTSADDCPHW